jgi:CYTH domain-containing protein
MADIEFEDEATMASFVAPDFLGKEVTHDTRFA